MKTIVSLALFVLIAAFVVSPVSAENSAEQHQEQELETSVVCETGSYGTTSKCEAKARGKQSQTQRIAILGASTHKMANTSLDTVSMIAAAGIITTGAGIATKKFILK